MAKKKPDYKLDGNIIATIKEHTNKHGKIKGKNKKQTRTLVGACPHHTLNKNGKIKPILSNDGKQTCTCRACGASFKGHPYSGEDVKRMAKGTKELVNQLKYLSVAVNAGNETVRFACELGSMLEHLPSVYKNVKQIAEKAEAVKNKKKKKKSNSNFSNVGGWR